MPMIGARIELGAPVDVSERPKPQRSVAGEAFKLHAPQRITELIAKLREAGIKPASDPIRNIPHFILGRTSPSSRSTDLPSEYEIGITLDGRPYVPLLRPPTEALAEWGRFRGAFHVGQAEAADMLAEFARAQGVPVSDWEPPPLEVLREHARADHRSREQLSDRKLTATRTMSVQAITRVLLGELSEADGLIHDDGVDYLPSAGGRNVCAVLSTLGIRPPHRILTDTGKIQGWVFPDALFALGVDGKVYGFRTLQTGWRGAYKIKGPVTDVLGTGQLALFRAFLDRRE